MMNEVTFSKLRSGDWGVCGPVDLLEAGSVVTVKKKSGATAEVTIKAIVWDNGERAIASIKPKPKNQPMTIPKAPAPVRTDEPEPGKIYRLTGDSSTPSVMRGDSLADCEVASESDVDLNSPSEDGWAHTQEDGWTHTPVTPPEPAPEALNGWGVCTECGVPGIRDVSGLGLSCGCAF